MNKQDKIIKLIDDRIKYYTGGWEMKSMNEIMGDDRVMTELNEIKKRILTGDF